jgi:hypothetical protein
MQWLYIILLTAVTFAALSHIDDKRRENEGQAPAQFTTKLAIFFTLLLIYFGIFHLFSDTTKAPKSARTTDGGAIAMESAQRAEVSDVSRIRDIRGEDCHSGIPPF